VWPEYSVEWTIGRTTYRFVVSNPDHRSRGIASAELDGQPVEAGAIPWIDDGGRHDVRVVLGSAAGGGPESSRPYRPAALAERQS
jgi:hypothetical protein